MWLYDVSSPNQPVRAGAVSVTSSVTQAGFALRLAMKGQYTEYITLHTKTKRAYVHLTPQIETILKKSGIKDGMILVSAGGAPLLALFEKWLPPRLPARSVKRQTRITLPDSNTD
ncbi:MAG TPA: hypothetical protein VEK84_09990 [Terriglobales bacterium]|nr:hypothetical protein [Terriglobales bacterium]